MRPYWAILKDSFREALASRVLWIVMGLITLFLLVIAPLSYSQLRTTNFRNEDVAEWPDLVKLLRESDAKTASPAVKRVWQKLPDDARAIALKFRPLPKQPTMRDARQFEENIGQVRRGLDKLLDDRELYDKSTWQGVKLAREGRELVGRQDQLDTEESRRLNRILIESAFPGLIEPSSATSIRFRYALYGEFGEAYPVSKKQLADGIRDLLPWLLDKFVLSIGLLVAVLVTAPIIPQTFDPGSLHLLLSKPIRRSGLYLTKFLGGCAFVLLCATYLFVGLYLLFGVRLDIWEPRMLWCIPIYAFVFAVYYSVAALAGIVWRSPVVAILMAVVFWGACFLMGLGKGSLEHIVGRARVEQIVPAGETVLVVDHSNTPRVWDEKKREWRTAFLAPEWAEIQWLLSNVAQFPPMEGPVYDPRSESLVGITKAMNGQELVASGQRSEQWKHREGPAAPSSTVALLSEPSGAPLILTNYGIQRVAPNLHAREKPLKFLGYTVPLATRGPLENVGPSPAPTWTTPLAFALDGASGALFVYSKGTLQRLQRGEDGKYSVQLERKVENNDDNPIRLAAAGSRVLVAHRDGPLKTFDSQTLTDAETYQPGDKARPTHVEGSPDGQRIAVLYADGRLWLLDIQSGKGVFPRVTGQQNISAVAFAADSMLLVADRTNRVLEYDPATLAVARRFTPALDFQEAAYRYVMLPLYTLFPKPGEFYKTVEHVLTPPAAEPDRPRRRDRDEAEDPASPWQPVWSSLAFMLVMLAAGCVYMQWQEF